MKQFIYTFGFEENLRPYVFGCKNHKEFLKRLKGVDLDLRDQDK